VFFFPGSLSTFGNILFISLYLNILLVKVEMEKSHRNRLQRKNLHEQFALNKLHDIHRCNKCNHYNNINPLISIQQCTFCGNPYPLPRFITK
jgi:hypothetical protein